MAFSQKHYWEIITLYRILKAIWKRCVTLSWKKASHKLPSSLHFSQNGIFVQLSKWDSKLPRSFSRRWWAFTPIGCKQLRKERPAGWARKSFVDQASSIKPRIVRIFLINKDKERRRKCLHLLSKSSLTKHLIDCCHNDWQFCQSLKIDILYTSSLKLFFRSLDSFVKMILEIYGC